MSRFDKKYDDDLEEGLLYNFVNENYSSEDEKNVAEFINEYFDRDLIKSYTKEKHLDYLGVLLQRIKELDKKSNTKNYDQPKNYLDLLQANSFQSCNNNVDKVKFLVFYLKLKYKVLNGQIFKDFLEELYGEEGEESNTHRMENDENSMTPEEYKDLFIMNFNKETIDLTNKNEEDEFIKFMNNLLAQTNPPPSAK